MSNIIDYMDWRGDLTFSMAPLNEVDGLIFAQLSYVELDFIYEKDKTQKLTIEEIAKLYFERYSEEDIAGFTLLLQNCSKVLKKMAETERFKNLIVEDYVAEFDPEKNKQFGVINVKIKEGIYYIAFRGTDDSLAGWEEDFQACYMMPVASQVEAASYIQQFFKTYSGKAYIGGHSKGGNLAVYATVMAGSKNKKRIKKVHNFDGPGFLQEFVEKSAYKKMAELVENYNPQASIVGMIMFRDDNVTIVASSEKGLMQHTGISWQVCGNHFVNAENFENMSLVFGNVNRSWINEISQEERAMLIEIVFKLLREGFDTVTGLKEGFFNTTTTILKSYSNLEKETRKNVKKIVGQVIKLSRESYSETKKEIKLFEEKTAKNVD